VKRIGEYLVERKILKPTEVEQILDFGRRENLRFGEAGVKLGLLSEDALVRVFGKNYRVDFFHLDGKFFPRQTSQILSLDTILKYGVLPLGFKNEYGLFKSGRILNLGMLDPGRADALKVAVEESKVQAESNRTKVFLILAEQFLDVLQSVYGISHADVAKRNPERLEPTLAMFLEERL
jgi:hypothetical protein